MTTQYIEGRQDTGKILQFERKVDVPNEIFWLEKDMTPLLHLSVGNTADDKKLLLRKQETINPQFDVLEKEPHGRWAAVDYSTGYTAGAVTIKLTSVTHIRVGMIVKNVIAEDVARVTAKNNSASTVTLQRGYGATAAAAWAHNDPILVVGIVAEENAPVPAMLGVQNRKRTNYTAIMRWAYGLSRTAKNSAYYGGDKENELKQEAMIQWKKMVESAFLWSEPSEDPDGGDGGEPIRSTGGVWYWGTTGGAHITTATTTFTKQAWMTFQRTAFEVGDHDTLVVLCSPLVIEMLNFWKDNKLEMRPSDEFYNLRVAEWESGQGRFILIRDKFLQNSPVGTTTAGYGGCAIALPPKTLRYRYLTDSDMKILVNVQRDGRDGYTDEILAEIGLGVTNPETWSILKNVQSYS